MLVMMMVLVIFFWRAKEKLASIARAFREGESIPVPVVAPGGEEKEAKEEREGRRDFAEQMRMGGDSGRRPDPSSENCASQWTQQL